MKKKETHKIRSVIGAAPMNKMMKKIKKKETIISNCSSMETAGIDNSFLPEDIMVNILHRLPAESVLQCRLVCKTWRNTVNSPSFAHMHLQRQLDDRNVDNAAEKVGFIFLKSMSPTTTTTATTTTTTGTQLFYVEYDENDERQSCQKQKKINHYPPVKYQYGIVGSCNGLICMSVGNHDQIYICNPITGEYVNLPRSSIYSYSNRIASGFGYLPSTNQYKVVRIYSCKNEDFHMFQVYTLGCDSRCWRYNKVGIQYKLQFDHLSNNTGISANGVLYWLDKRRKIVAFDLADGNFQLLQSPPIHNAHHFNRFQLGVFQGGLCFVHCFEDKNLDIWSLKKNKNSNYDAKEQEHQNWSWSRDYSINLQGSMARLFALTRSGKLLFSSNMIPLSRYDMKTATLQELSDYGSFPDSVEAVPHLNSFVSLKALGEKETKEFRSLRRSARFRNNQTGWDGTGWEE